MGPFEVSDAVMAAEFKEHSKRVHEWLQKWPNHCKKCGGWGGKHIPGGSDTPDDYDICEATASISTCHRCGHTGLDIDGNGPCSHCGWDYNDGLPIF